MKGVIDRTQFDLIKLPTTMVNLIPKMIKDLVEFLEMALSALLEGIMPYAFDGKTSPLE